MPDHNLTRRRRIARTAPGIDEETLFLEKRLTDHGWIVVLEGEDDRTQLRFGLDAEAADDEFEGAMDYFDLVELTCGDSGPIFSTLA